MAVSSDPRHPPARPDGQGDAAASQHPHAARRARAELLSRDQLAALMPRNDRDAAWRLAGHLALLGLGEWAIAASRGSLWVWPAVFLTGVVLVHLFAPQHECAHFSAFRTRRANAVVAWLCGLAIIVPQLHFRYEHTEHHAQTNLVGRDPERIPMPRSAWEYLSYLSGLPYWWSGLSGIVRRALGRLNDEEIGFTPVPARPRLVLEARVMAAVYAGAALAIAAGVDALLWHWVLPLLLGQPVMRWIRMTEHVGCVTEPEPLRNTRSTDVAAPWRWLAWNMNYHAEHHIAPPVPFHALPRLREQLGASLPVRQGYGAAHREIVSQLRMGNRASRMG
ncbi:MAG: fatty acid desaturase [Rubrivivax sp.]